MWYQDGYRSVTAQTHGDFIVLPHWETKPLAPMTRFPTQSLHSEAELITTFLVNVYSWVGYLVMVLVAQSVVQHYQARYECALLQVCTRKTWNKEEKLDLNADFI